MAQYGNNYMFNSYSYHGHIIYQCQHIAAEISLFDRIASLALGQSFDCPDASEVILQQIRSYGR